MGKKLHIEFKMPIYWRGGVKYLNDYYSTINVNLYHRVYFSYLHHLKTRVKKLVLT